MKIKEKHKKNGIRMWKVSDDIELWAANFGRLTKWWILVWVGTFITVDIDREVARKIIYAIGDQP